MIKRRWLDILAKGAKKQHDQQLCQRVRLEQKEVEVEAAEALLQGTLRSKCSRRDR